MIEMNELKPLYVIGAGGFGREIVWLAETINSMKTEWDIKGFIDDDSSLWNNEISGYKVLGGMDYFSRLDSAAWCVIAIGNSKIRQKVAERLTDYKIIQFATLIAPDVRIGTNSIVGEGTMICMGSIITVDVKIGNHNIINLDCTVGHDVVFNDYVTLYPSVNISGGVIVEKATEIGTGSHVIQGVRIGRGSIIGAGSTVIRDIEDEVTAVGSPAKAIKYH